jgi:hypothetical protein
MMLSTISRQGTEDTRTTMSVRRQMLLPMVLEDPVNMVQLFVETGREVFHDCIKAEDGRVYNMNTEKVL